MASDNTNWPMRFENSHRRFECSHYGELIQGWWPLVKFEWCMSEPEPFADMKGTDTNIGNENDRATTCDKKSWW
jgi:hypothetical protein